MSTAHVFDRLYTRYDSWYERHPALAYSELLTVACALGDPGYPCVEVGVGTGWFAHKVGCRFGVDPSLGMLKIARKRGLEVVAGIGENLPFRDSGFSSALLVVTLCFVDDPMKVVEELSRILRKDGILVACIVPRDSPWGNFYVKLSARGHPFYSVARFYTVKEVDDLISSFGFVKEEACATLTSPPGVERVELPRPYRGGEGFVCLRYRRK